MGRTQVLVIDSDPAVVNALADLCNLTVATTGEDGVSKLCRLKVGLVVLENRLPDRTGLGIVVEIKRRWPGGTPR